MGREFPNGRWHENEFSTSGLRFSPQRRHDRSVIQNLAGIVELAALRQAPMMSGIGMATGDIPHGPRVTHVSPGSGVGVKPVYAVSDITAELALQTFDLCLAQPLTINNHVSIS